MTHIELDEFIDTNWGEKLTRMSGTQAEFDALPVPFGNVAYFITDTFEIQFFFPDSAIPGTGQWAASGGGGDLAALLKVQNELDLLTDKVYSEHPDASALTDANGDVLVYVDGEYIIWDNLFDGDAGNPQMLGQYSAGLGFVKNQEIEHNGVKYWANTTRNAHQNTVWEPELWRKEKGTFITELADEAVISVPGEYMVVNSGATTVTILDHIDYVKISDPYSLLNSSGWNHLTVTIGTGTQGTTSYEFDVGGGYCEIFQSDGAVNSNNISEVPPNNRVHVRESTSMFNHALQAKI